MENDKLVSRHVWTKRLTQKRLQNKEIERSSIRILWRTESMECKTEYKGALGTIIFAYTVLNNFMCYLNFLLVCFCVV